MSLARSVCLSFHYEAQVGIYANILFYFMLLTDTTLVQNVFKVEMKVWRAMDQDCFWLPQTSCISGLVFFTGGGQQRDPQSPFMQFQNNLVSGPTVKYMELQEFLDPQAVIHHLPPSI